jgi:hypothetical protein
MRPIKALCGIPEKFIEYSHIYWATDSVAAKPAKLALSEQSMGLM